MYVTGNFRRVPSSFNLALDLSKYKNNKKKETKKSNRQSLHPKNSICKYNIHTLRYFYTHTHSELIQTFRQCYAKSNEIYERVYEP